MRPLVFTVDDRYIRPLAVALESLRRQGGAVRPVVVVHERLALRHQRRLQHWLSDSCLQLSFVQVRAPQLSWRLPHHFSAACLLRLVMAPHLPFENYIYLDADVLVCRPLDPLDQLDLGGAVLAAAAWTTPRDLSPQGFGLLQSYFASGLLVVNRRRFLETKMGPRCLQLLRQHRFAYPDQDTLNLCGEHWLPLPEGWVCEVDGSEPSRLLAATSPLLLQLAGANKPWHPGAQHGLRAQFVEHLRNTPYRWSPPGPADWRWRSLGSRLAQWLLHRSKISTKR